MSLKTSLPKSTTDVLAHVTKLTDTCLIPVSRGKDSVACLLIVREYFKTVVPYYTVNIPTKVIPRHENEYLTYLENKLDIKIRLFLNGDVGGSFIGGFVFQPWQDVDEIYGLEDMKYYKYFGPTKYIREELDCSDAWGCSGIKGCDNGLMRRMFTKRGIGIREEDTSFYPLWDWTHKQVFEFMQKQGVALPSDYLCYDKTIMGVPTAPQLEWLKENMTDDFEKVKIVYPLIEAQLARNEFRKQHQARR